MGGKTVQVETTAEAYLEILADRGIEYFFANAGTDFAPLIDAFAHRHSQGKKMPRCIAVPHENAAVAMAHGHYLVTGKPQVVMVHVTVGTANAINGIINAAREQIPIVFTAGRTPITEAGLPGTRDLYIHWSQESFDQAGMLREYVKWDYELRNFAQLETVVDRALEIAMAEPRGPVYLTLPREVLAEPRAEFTLSSPARRHLAGHIHPDPAAIEQAARTLAAAHNPLILTSAAGSTTEAVAHLAALAETAAIPVVAVNQRYMCLPTHHPLHLGFSPGPLLATADAVLAIDCDVPWYPSLKTPPPQCQIMQMGVDPFYTSYPIRGFPCDVAIRAHSAVGIPLLTEALAPHLAGRRAQIAERFSRLQAAHEQQRAARQKALDRVRHDSPLHPAWVSHCINGVKEEDAIVLNEYDLVLSQMDFTRPGTFFGNPSSAGLGWGLGASLGVKLAAREKLVILAVGDGSYMFGNPTPCHFVSRAQGLPTLTVIFNNSQWTAVKTANLQMYPQGWAAKTGNFPLTQLEPSPHYEKIVTASGGYGERVDRAEEVKPALERALRAIQEEGRQAVLNMICKRP